MAVTHLSSWESVCIFRRISASCQARGREPLSEMEEVVSVLTATLGADYVTFNLLVASPQGLLGATERWIAIGGVLHPLQAALGL